MSYLSAGFAGLITLKFLEYQNEIKNKIKTSPILIFSTELFIYYLLNLTKSTPINFQDIMTCDFNGKNFDTDTNHPIYYKTFVAKCKIDKTFLESALKNFTVIVVISNIIFYKQSLKKWLETLLKCETKNIFILFDEVSKSGLEINYLRKSPLGKYFFCSSDNETHDKLGIDNVKIKNPRLDNDNLSDQKSFEVDENVEDKISSKNDAIAESTLKSTKQFKSLTDFADEIPNAVMSESISNKFLKTDRFKIL